VLTAESIYSLSIFPEKKLRKFFWILFWMCENRKYSSPFKANATSKPAKNILKGPFPHGPLPEFANNVPLKLRMAIAPPPFSTNRFRITALHQIQA
jgi:hypothetical protein